MKQALLVGIGKMGVLHAATILNDQLTDKISLAAVADCDPARLIKFRQDHPDTPVILIPKNGQMTDQDRHIAIENNIPIHEDVKSIIEDYQCDTLINATHNNSHAPILDNAFNARDENGQTLIRTVFQEKPFAHDQNDAERIAKIIEHENITFNLNGILTFSPIWQKFIAAVGYIQKQDFQLVEIRTSYGKDRTKDTRPAQGGYVGMEAIHALDISTYGLTEMKFHPETARTKTGFLAANANDETGDGIVTYAIECQMTARTVDGKPVKIKMEGSYAWAQQSRRVQYELRNKNGEKIILQLDFDIRHNTNLTDRLTIAEYDKKQQMKNHPKVYESSTDKLTGYYLSVLDPNDTRPIYGLERALAVNAMLKQMEGPAKQDIRLDSAHAPKSPSMAGIQTLNAPPRQMKNRLFL